jgi:hypothetical protein
MLEYIETFDYNNLLFELENDLCHPSFIESLDDFRNGIPIKPGMIIMPDGHIRYRNIYDLFSLDLSHDDLITYKEIFSGDKDTILQHCHNKVRRLYNNVKVGCLHKYIRDYCAEINVKSINDKMIYLWMLTKGFHQTIKNYVK